MMTEHPERLQFAVDFRLGEWLVEPSLDRLSRNGTVIRLRPQLTDMLVLLARHAGQTVSKDLILARVWDGQSVAESGMTRCIAEIRQALEDDAREPKYIETIPKRGYRLLAPVVFLKPSGRPEAGEPTRPPLAAVEPAPPETDPAAALPMGRRPDRRAAWAVTSVLGVSLLAALGWGAGSWGRTPVLSGRDTVLLADVANTTGERVFDETVRLALAVHLGQAPFLRILSNEHVRRALALMGRPADQPVVGTVALEICRREAAAVLLTGSIAKVGSHYALGIEAIACVGGASIDQELLEVDGKEQVLAGFGTLATRLRRTLGETRPSLRRYDVPIVQATTPSLEALEALSLGDFHRDHARLADALAFYRRATDLDPQFALAWARRGAAARNLGLSVGEEPFGAADEPTLSLRKAYDLRDRVTEAERFYILGHYYRLVAGNPDEAVETYRLWQRVYPGSAVAPTNLASLYANTFGRYDAALPEAREAVRLAPYSSLAHKALIVAYLGTGQLPEARRALTDAASRGAADLLWHALAFQMAFADGDTPGMREHARWASGNPRATIVMTQYRALAAASAGRLREARQLWSEAASSAAEIAAPGQQAAIRLKEAETEALLGDPNAARLAAEAALALDRRPGTLLPAAIVFALSGDPARAGRLIDEASRVAEPGICSKFVWGPVSRALVEAASGRTGQARAILRAAAPFERGRDFGLAPLGARARIELAAGLARESAATLEELLRLRAVAPTSPWVAFSRLGLARALRDAGDVSGSQRAYDAVLDDMTGADADAPLLVAARRERAALGSR